MAVQVRRRGREKGSKRDLIQAQIPIVPVVASSYKCFYSHTEHYFDHDGEVIIEVMDPIPTTGVCIQYVPYYI